MLNPLLAICVIFVVTPPHIFGKKLKPSKWFKIHTAFVLILLFGGYIYHVLGKQTDPLFESVDITINFIDYFTTSILILTNVAVIASVCFFRAEKFRGLLRSFESFDYNVNLRVKNGRSKLLLHLIYAQVAVISTLTVDAVTWIGYLGMRGYKYFIFRNIQWYHFNLAIFLIFRLAIEIMRRLRKVNVLLWQSVKGNVNGSSFSTRIDLLDKPYLIRVANYELLKSIKVRYADLSKMVDEFNSLFGIILLGGVLFNITNIVFYTQLVMVYVVFQNGGIFGPYVVVNSLMWIASAFLQTMAVAAICDGIEKEAKRVSQICYILLNDVPSIPKSLYDVILKEELLLIAEQSSSKKLCVSAAGFFEVNFGMMGFIVASVTSYIIVTIQFVSDA